MIAHTLERLLSYPSIAGAMVVLAADDAYWRDSAVTDLDKPVLTCVGGAERADSVLAGVDALPDTVRADAFVLVHDAARPNLAHADLDRLLDLGRADPVGAILAAPVRDTLKRADGNTRSAATEPREHLWRALTPQMFRRGGLTRALSAAMRAGAAVTDEASAMERLGLKPRLVEGSEDNIKVTTPADLAVAEYILTRVL